MLRGRGIAKRYGVGRDLDVFDRVVTSDKVTMQSNVAPSAGGVTESEVFLRLSCVLEDITNPRCQVSRHALGERTLVCLGSTVEGHANGTT